VGGAKVYRQRALWKLKRSKLFHDCACVAALSSGERISGFVPVREIPAVCLKTTSVSHNTQTVVGFMEEPVEMVSEKIFTN